MIGALVAGGLAIAGSAIGGALSSRAARKAQREKKKALDKQLEQNQRWYERGYNEDATMRADTQRLLTRAEDAIRKRNKELSGQQAVMGGSEEAVAAAKAEAREAEEIVTRSAVLDKIKEENAALKRRVQELEQTPPQVVTQTVEVVPEDYEQTKKALEDAKYTAARAEKDLQTMRQKYETARDNAEHLAQKIGESTEAAKAERDIQYFTTATHDYIRRYGGHVWAFNEIQNVSETVRGDYIKAIKALDAFAQQMITNIEGGLK
jgi:chromosome segregation ATPase